MNPRFYRQLDPPRRVSANDDTATGNLPLLASGASKQYTRHMTTYLNVILRTRTNEPARRGWVEPTLAACCVPLHCHTEVVT